MLRTPVLTFNHDTSRNVHNAHCRIGLVNVLTTRTRRAEGVDTQVRRIDRDVFHRIGFGQDRHGAGARVDAALRLGDRHALHAMRARFKLHF